MRALCRDPKDRPPGQSRKGGKHGKRPETAGNRTRRPLVSVFTGGRRLAMRALELYLFSYSVYRSVPVPYAGMADGSRAMGTGSCINTDGKEDRMRNSYEELELTVIRFAAEDVISTSGSATVQPQDPKQDNM